MARLREEYIYDPLETCPVSLKPFYAKMAARAINGQFKAVCHLTCLKCKDWIATERATCIDTSCPIWIKARPDLWKNKDPKKVASMNRARAKRKLNREQA